MQNKPCIIFAITQSIRQRAGNMISDVLVDAIHEIDKYMCFTCYQEENLRKEILACRETMEALRIKLDDVPLHNKRKKQ